MSAAGASAAPVPPPVAATAGAASTVGADAGASGALAFLFAGLLPAAAVTPPLATLGAQKPSSVVVADNAAGTAPDTAASAAAQFIDLLLPPASSSTLVLDEAAPTQATASDAEGESAPIVDGAASQPPAAAAPPIPPAPVPLPLPVMPLPAVPTEAAEAATDDALLPPALPLMEAATAAAASPASTATPRPVPTTAPDFQPVDHDHLKRLATEMVTLEPMPGVDADAGAPRIDTAPVAAPAMTASPQAHGAGIQPAPTPPAAPPAPVTPPPPALPSPLDASALDWSAALGEHIAWRVDQGEGEAQVELHPAELGSLTIRVETQGDQARVSIVAAESAARDLLQQSLPQLRELLMAQGLQLTRAQVDRPSPRGQGEAGGSPGRPAETLVPRRRITQIALVDAYA
ncbi:flagellar hook-length control protein FliK [Methylibium sp.]|uniref:flagellar hook-length control protein FliK n=1 Tax=Methylibium sp. TaxID=2067992 RepID=UPI00333EA0D5